MVMEADAMKLQAHSFWAAGNQTTNLTPNASWDLELCMYSVALLVAMVASYLSFLFHWAWPIF